MSDAGSSPSSASASAPTTGPSPPTSASSGGNEPSKTLVRRAKPRLAPRRGHTKSKTGCLSCKRRRVKCDEGSPECAPCRRLGLQCEYAHSKGTVVRAQTAVFGVEDVGDPGRGLRTSPGVLEMGDLRFFHHFLLDAFPPLPIRGRQVWHYVSQMTHQYEFLARAILGLGASHLSLMTTTNYSRPALNHRISSISTLNEHLSKPHLEKTDADAALGALLALTFQSAYMPDGMVDFLTMVRGCVLVATHKTFNFEQSVFKPIEKDAFVRTVHQIVDDDDPNNQLYRIFAFDFCQSLERLSTICSSTAELTYISTMNNIAALAVTNPVASFCEHSFIYNKVGELSNTDFASFVDPSNIPSQLVIMHLLILDFVMSRKAVDEASETPTNIPQGRTGFDGRKSVTMIWIEKIMARLPSDHHVFAKGVFKFARRLTEEFLGSDGAWRPFLIAEKGRSKGV